MKKRIRVAALAILTVVVAACSSAAVTDESQPSSVNQVETAVAMTLQALAPGTREATEPTEPTDAIVSTATPSSVPESGADLLPRSLYFLATDSQSISQIYRLERDGKTKTQLTFEPYNIWDYDVSPADASLAYEMSGQLVLVNADGSNRRVLASVPTPDVQGLYHPVFSPDGQMLAYARGGLNLYTVSTGASTLVITDQYTDPSDGPSLPVETYAPESYSPDGKKLLLALGHWEVAPSHAVYDPDTNTLVKYQEVQDYIYCCSFHGGPVWSPDSSSFYGVASVHDTAYRSGEIWRVDAANGAITRTLRPGDDGTLNLPKEVFVAPDGKLYYFLGTYRNDSGYFEAPVLQMVRSAPDGVTDRAVLRDDNFVMMEEALWAPDASFVIVATAIGRDWNDMNGGVLELYYTDGQKDTVWLAPFGREMKWGT